MRKKRALKLKKIAQEIIKQYPPLTLKFAYKKAKEMWKHGK
jgi:hypothetical protein